MDIEQETSLKAFNHPLDCVEHILGAQNWVFDRVNDNELNLELAGKNCVYRLLFVWQEEVNALQLCCQYQMKIDRTNMDRAARSLMNLNEKLIMGHFEVSEETAMPCFRHASLLRGSARHTGIEQIEDLVDISIVQCERFYHVFHLLAEDQKEDDKRLSLALMNPMGQA